jgi:serine/threonine-protein kinase HipA
MLTLARACGLMTADSRVVDVAGRDVLLVKRFDREKTDAGYRRARAADWGLSPAYDLTLAVPVSLERRDLAMECGDAGRYANAENLLSQSARFLLDAGEGRALVDAMEAQVHGTWFAVARAAGVSETDCEKIASAFSYPGFREDRQQR